jgi:hypothetical protein
MLNGTGMGRQGRPMGMGRAGRPGRPMGMGRTGQAGMGLKEILVGGLGIHFYIHSYQVK